jgi:hypothetical protein
VVFPFKREEITCGWLSDVLGSDVKGYETQVLDGAHLSNVYRLHSIAYGNHRPGPPSVVVKCPHHVKEIRDFAMAGSAYVKEVKFLCELAGRVPLRTPVVYGCFSDGSAASERFIIVMEDLTSHSKVFDQVDDVPDESFARQTARSVARLHAQCWETDVTRLPWVSQPDGRYLPPLHFLSAMAKQASPVFFGLWRQMYGRDFFAAGEAPLEELTELLCGSRSFGIHRRIYETLSRRPKTLLHGDLRADNIFRTNSAKRTTGGEPTLTFIDFQLVHAGPPGPELTQAWVHSLEPAVRRQETSMLREYRETLVSLNPAAATYSYDMLLEDYTLATCLWWTMGITLGAQTLREFERPEGARQKRLWQRAEYRMKSALSDLDCIARIRDIASGLPDD